MTRSSWNCRPRTNLPLRGPQICPCPPHCPILISPLCQRQTRTSSTPSPMTHLSPHPIQHLRTRWRTSRRHAAPLRDAIRRRTRLPPRFPERFLLPPRLNFTNSGIHAEPSRITNGIQGRLIRPQTSNNSTIFRSNSRIQSRRSSRLYSSFVPLKYWIRQRNSFLDVRYQFRPPLCLQSSRV